LWARVDSCPGVCRQEDFQDSVDQDHTHPVLQEGRASILTDAIRYTNIVHSTLPLS
jgi:hypothetical protein